MKGVVALPSYTGSDARRTVAHENELQPRALKRSSGPEHFHKDYPMTQWNGWWEQRALGRQEMHNLVLDIDPSGKASGGGDDCIGKFTFSGTIFPNVELVKQYVGRHSVLYRGTNSGEGIFGQWFIPGFEAFTSFGTGRFALFPASECCADGLGVRELNSIPPAMPPGK